MKYNEHGLVLNRLLRHQRGVGMMGEGRGGGRLNDV